MLPLLVLLQNELVGNESDDLSKTLSFRLSDYGSAPELTVCGAIRKKWAVVPKRT